jgi:hypothetical protein
MTRTNPLRRTGTRLRRQGTVLFQETRTASETLLVESRDASAAFGHEITAATSKWAGSTRRSLDGFRDVLVKEALDWQKLVLQSRDAYVAAISERLRRVERQALNTREALTPEVVETTVLESARGLLQRAQERVDERLEHATKPAPRQKPKKATAPKPRSKPKSGKDLAENGQVPLRNYDRLTAKDVVTRIQRLSGPQVAAVLEYERSRKKRATVIRAVEQRLSAAG